jgi:hypothetical protein
MSHYFFHRRIRGTLIRDVDGCDLEDMAAVLKEAREGVRALTTRTASELDDAAFEIHDAAGRLVIRYPFRAAFEPPDPKPEPAVSPDVDPAPPKAREP